MSSEMLTTGQLVSDAEIAALAATAGLRMGDTRLEDRLARDVRSARAALAAALERERVLREAVKWYADPEVWTGKYGSGGSIARAALATVATSQGQEVTS